MNSLDSIKKQIAFLYKNHPDIHVNIAITHPRVNLQNDPARITGVYPNVFMIEKKSSGFTKRHSLQYSDILTKQIEIVEITKHA